MRYEGRSFEGQTVDLDGNEFFACTFHNSNLVFRATGEPITLLSCRFLAPWRVLWAGAAEETLKVLSQFHREGTAEQQALVDQIFGQIRRVENPAATLRLLSWDRLRSVGASSTMSFLSVLNAQGVAGRETIDALFADIKSGDFRQRRELTE